MTEIVSEYGSPAYGSMNEKLEEIKNYNCYQLSNLADCQSPDSRTSEGAEFLMRVKDAVFEAWEYNSGVLVDEGEFAHQIADDAPSIYTHKRWLQYVDLGAYTEEPECDEWPTDPTDMAAVALCQIAEKLVYALLGEILEASFTEDNRNDIEVDEFFVNNMENDD